MDAESQDDLLHRIPEVAYLNLLDEGRKSTIAEIVQSEIAVDEVAVYFKENESMILFFNSKLSKDWLDTIALTEWSLTTSCIIGQYDTQYLNGFIQEHRNETLIKHVTKFSNALSFPVYPVNVQRGNETDKLSTWMDIISTAAMGSPIVDVITNSKNKQHPVTIFKFEHSLAYLAHIKSDLKNKTRVRREEALKHFRAFVEERSSASAAFESNSNDKVIYQFLDKDYPFINHWMGDSSEIGKHPDFNSIVDVFLNGSNIEIIQLIERLAQDANNFDGLFDVLLYTGLYFNDNKLRANALALAVIITNGTCRENFWQLWERNFYDKKIILPSFTKSIAFPQTPYALAYTNLIQHKFAVVNTPEMPSPKSLVIDSDLNSVDGSFLSYFDEIVIQNQTRLLDQDLAHFFTSLSYYDTTIKSLVVTNCNITALYSSLTKLPLTTLNISNNPIKGIENLKFNTLEQLIIRNTGIKSISMKWFPALKTLVLGSLEELDGMHLVDINYLKSDFYFEVSKQEGAKSYFNFKKEPIDPFKVVVKKPFWKVW
jgi:hypothetical protein